MPYIKYTDAEIKAILKHLTVICDSREQKNDHITEYFSGQGIPFQSNKLESGDYSATLPALPEHGIIKPLHFDDAVVVERKATLEELSGNLTKERERLQDEFTRLRGRKVFLMVENPEGYKAILEHKYRTQYNPKSFLASLLAFQERYNLNITFLDKSYSGIYVYSILYYHVRNYLIKQ